VNVLDPPQKGFSAEDAEFPKVDGRSIQVFFLDYRFIEPGAITPALRIGRASDRMVPSPARKPKPGGYGSEADGRAL